MRTLIYTLILPIALQSCGNPGPDLTGEWKGDGATMLIQKEGDQYLVDIEGQRLSLIL